MTPSTMLQDSYLDKVSLGALTPVGFTAPTIAELAAAGPIDIQGEIRRARVGEALAQGITSVRDMQRVFDGPLTGTDDGRFIK